MAMASGRWRIRYVESRGDLTGLKWFVMVGNAPVFHGREK